MTQLPLQHNNLNILPLPSFSPRTIFFHNHHSVVDSSPHPPPPILLILLEFIVEKRPIKRNMPSQIMWQCGSVWESLSYYKDSGCGSHLFSKYEPKDLGLECSLSIIKIDQSWVLWTRCQNHIHIWLDNLVWMQWNSSWFGWSMDKKDWCCKK